MTSFFLSRNSFMAMFVALQIVASAAQRAFDHLHFDSSVEDLDEWITTLIEWNDMLKDIKNDSRTRRKDTDFEGDLEKYRSEVMEIGKRIRNDFKKAEAPPKDKSLDYSIISPELPKSNIPVNVEMLKQIWKNHASEMDRKISDRYDLVASLNRSLNTERDEFYEAVEKCRSDLHQTLMHCANEIGQAQGQLIAKAAVYDYDNRVDAIHTNVDLIQSLVKPMYSYFDMNEVISPYEVADLVNKRADQAKKGKALLISIEQSLKDLKENDDGRYYFRQTLSTLSKELNVRNCAGLSMYNPKIDFILNTLPMDLERILSDKKMKTYKDQIEKLDEVDTDIASTYFTIRTLEQIISTVEHGVKDTVIWKQTEAPKFNWVRIYHVLKHFVEKQCGERQAALRKCILQHTQSI